jgi:hypothetical protein
MTYITNYSETWRCQPTIPFISLAYLVLQATRKTGMLTVEALGPHNRKCGGARRYPMVRKLELNREEVEKFISEVDSILVCKGKSCLEDAIKEYLKKLEIVPDDRTYHQLRSIYENHKALYSK